MQCCQDSNGILYRRKEPPKTMNNQNNLEKEQSWRHYTSQFWTILQSYSNYNNMAQTQRTTEQNQEYRNKPMLYDWLIFEMGANYTQWGEIVSLIKQEKLDNHMQIKKKEKKKLDPTLYHSQKLTQNVLKT